MKYVTSLSICMTMVSSQKITNNTSTRRRVGDNEEFIPVGVPDAIINRHK